MFFKSLDLHGFKSFATKTTIDFQPGITVIVGPNGCGKSNISDSIRWCLGEHSARQLRGTRMSDVIFSGSGALKAQGVAQVSLTIANDDRRLPIDFSEVNVARRLYADGTSEYLLNKTPCRRRDITDLFLNTGVGAHGYSVMEQGKIEAIINARPVERRYIFEEAAGISKFRMRRAEALRKLERADLDFQRLSDLIAEVRRQANSLKRQTSKAKRYRRLTEEAQQVERALLSVRHALMRQRLTERTKEHAEWQDRLTALSTRLADLEAAQERGHMAETEMAETLSETRSGLFDVVSEIERQEHAIVLLRERIAEGERRREEIGGAAEAAAREEMDTATELGRARLELKELHESKIEIEAAHQENLAEFEDMRSGREAMLGRLNALRVRLNELLEKKSTAENSARFARALIQRLDQQIEAGDRKHEELRAGVDALQTRAGEYERRLAETARALEEKKAELTGLDRSHEEASRRGEELRVQVNERKHKEGEARSKLKALEDLEASYQGYFEGVKLVMQAAGEGRLGGLIGIVAQLVRSPAEYELAIEAALGSHVQDIVTRTADDARRAVEFLKASQRGRATFQPLDLLELRRPNASFEEALGRPGVVGAAIGLVQHEPQVEKAIQFLLGTTLVVETLERSIALEREGLRQRYVSLDGQILTPHGSISGGSVRASGLLGREREIHELRATSVALATELKDLTRQADDLRESMRIARDRVSTLRDEIHSLQVSQAELAKDRDACATSLEERRVALDEYDARRQEWLDEIHTHRDAIEEGEQTAAAIQDEIAKREADLKAKQGEMAVQDTQVDALAGALSELSAEIASVTERIDRIGSRRSRMAARQWALSEAQIRRRAEILSVGGRRAETDSEIEQARESLGGLFERRRAVEREIAALEQDREAMVHASRERTQALHSLQSDRNDLQNTVQEAALAKNEVEVHLSQLREQSHERFGCEIEALLTAPSEGEESEFSAPEATAQSETELRLHLNALNDKIGAMGAVNLTALEEYEEQAARLEFLTNQERDLSEARRQLSETIAQIDETTKKMFSEAFESIRSHFIEMFRRLFGGGRADLVLTEPEGGDPLLDGGIDIVAQPPGKKLQHITLLSGGEKALTAISLLFGIFLHRPSPFCILDEIDAPLDDNNIERFKGLLAEFGRQTQFIVITHNKQTMTLADTIYGITMEEAGVSKLVAVRFDESLSLVG
jgi:chromosome segregation protein